MSNIENDFPSRGQFPAICQITKQTLYKHFTPRELSEIEKEGLDLRRKQCAGISAKVDRGLVASAMAGDAAACKLYYQRIEGWSEKHQLEQSGPGGKPIENRMIIEFVTPDHAFEEGDTEDSDA